MRNIFFGAVLWIALIGILLASCSPTPPVLQTVEPGKPAEAYPAVQTVESGKILEPQTADQPSVETAAVLPDKRPVLRVTMGYYPDTLDPQKASALEEGIHLQMIYEGLTRLNGKLETVPGAAESWAYNADGTEITFTLRNGLKYADGSVLNARRFEYALFRNIDPQIAAPYNYLTDDITGAKEWRNADSTAAGYDAESLKANVKIQALDSEGHPCTSYEQPDCLTLNIGLARPNFNFHSIMSFWAISPAREELIQKGGPNWWNLPELQIGNGPFVLQNLNPSVISYVPNPAYWRGQATYDLAISPYGGVAVAIEEYKNNNLDIVSISSEGLPLVKSDPVLSQELNSYPIACAYAIQLNQRKPPFDDPKVRQAFTLAVDREAWVKRFYPGSALPTLTWVPGEYAGFSEGKTRWGFDPQQARQVLSESTYGSVGELPEVTVAFTDYIYRYRWEWLAAQWKEILGVEIKLNQVGPETLAKLLDDANTRPQMFFDGWCADYPDPQNWLTIYGTSGLFAEMTGYSNPSLDALLDAASAKQDPGQRLALYQQAQDLLIEDTPAIFMMRDIGNYLVKPWVKGAVRTSQDWGWMGIQDPLTISIDSSQISVGGTR